MPNSARIRITRVVAPNELVDQMLPKMRNLGEAIGSRAQRIVPKRSWALHDTITAGAEQSGPAAVTTTVGVGGGEVDYWEAVEKGTSKMAAQPYMRPAFAQTTGRDLNYKGKGVTRHGVVTVTTRRGRARARRAGA